MLIDSHAHLAGEKFDTDRATVLQRAQNAGVTHIVIIGELTPDARDLARTDSGHLFFTAGVHPHEAHTFDAARDLLLLRDRLADGAVAIGECGLDYYYDHSPREQQLAAFRAQLELAAEVDLPVVVHTRQAEDDTVEFMQRAAGAGVRGVLHCFTGSPELARAAIAAGWYVSLSGIATFRTWQRDDVVTAIPEHLLLVETDAPYLAPVPYRGKRNEPSFLPATLAHVARVRGVAPEQLAQQTAANAIRLFRLPIPLPQ